VILLQLVWLILPFLIWEFLLTFQLSKAWFYRCLHLENLKIQSRLIHTTEFFLSKCVSLNLVGTLLDQFILFDLFFLQYLFLYFSNNTSKCLLWKYPKGKRQHLLISIFDLNFTIFLEVMSLLVIIYYLKSLKDFQQPEELIRQLNLKKFQSYLRKDQCINSGCI
jgi:hypothetical protein